MDLARAIKLIRTASGMKQKEIAVKVGVTPNYLSLVENGKREPSISFLKRLAAVLGISVSLFFLWEQEETGRSGKNLDQVRTLLAQLEGMYISANRGKIRKKRAVA
jgi:transcriptional regulator with XRE-family HTH domain